MRLGLACTSLLVSRASPRLSQLLAQLAAEMQLDRAAESMMVRPVMDSLLFRLLFASAAFWPGSAFAEPAHVVWSTVPKAAIFVSADRGSARLGYLDGGAAVGLRSPALVPGPGCTAGFYRIEPRGAVCAADVTQDPHARAVASLRLLARRAGPYPYEYAFSSGAPIFRTPPSLEEAARREEGLGPPGTFAPRRWDWRHARLTTPERPTPGADVEALQLAFRRSPHAFAPNGVLLAYREVFRHNGRDWLLRADGGVLPANRVRLIRRSDFQGVMLGGELQLPVAWTKKDGVRLFSARPGNDEPTATSDGPALLLPARSFIPLTSAERHGDSLTTALRTKSGTALWLEESAAVSVVTAPRRPSFVGPRERWIWVSVRQGVLVALVGDTPVFTTLTSPGRGGASRLGRSNQQNRERSTTPLGAFRVQHKYWTRTMSSQRSKPKKAWTQWIEEVQFTQFFDVPFALHSSYWQEDLGQYMSNGCLNLSPRDAERLFNWTEPALPPGWAGLFAHKSHGPGTRIVIHR